MIDYCIDSANLFVTPGGRLGEGGSYESGWTSTPGLPGETQESGAWRGWTHDFW